MNHISTCETVMIILFLAPGSRQHCRIKSPGDSPGPGAHHLPGPGARFSKLPVITGPVKLFCFPFQMRVSKGLKIRQ